MTGPISCCTGAGAGAEDEPNMLPNDANTERGRWRGWLSCFSLNQKAAGRFSIRTQGQFMKSSFHFRMKLSVHSGTYKQHIISQAKKLKQQKCHCVRTQAKLWKSATQWKQHLASLVSCCFLQCTLTLPVNSSKPRIKHPKHGSEKVVENKRLHKATLTSFDAFFHGRRSWWSAAGETAKQDGLHPPMHVGCVSFKKQKFFNYSNISPFPVDFRKVRHSETSACVFCLHVVQNHRHEKQNTFPSSHTGVAIITTSNLHLKNVVI